METSNSVPLGRSLWHVASFIALLFAIPVTLLANSMPWLIIVPIVGGSVYVLVLSIAPEVDRPRSLLDVGRSLKSAKRKYLNRGIAITINNPIMLPRRPESYLPIDGEVFKQFSSATRSPIRLILKGEQNLGKRTLVQEFCRQSNETTRVTEHKKRPVYIAFSRGVPRTNGVKSLCIDMIAEYIVAEDRVKLIDHIKQMLHEGLFCLFMADLEFLSKEDYRDLQDFMAQSNRNSFVLILNENLEIQKSFSTGFQVIDMPRWTADNAREYLRDRITDPVTRNELITFFEKNDGFHRNRTPYYWKCIVDLAREHLIHQYIVLDKINVSDMTEFDLLQRLSDKVLKDTGDYDGYLKAFGKLALNLLKQGRYDFTYEQLKQYRPDPQLRNVANRLFAPYLGCDSFQMDITQLLLYASRYLASYWPEAQEELQANDARALLWTPVYASTEPLMPAAFRSEFEDKFRSLYGIFPDSQAAA
jgi:hypothetical protein